MSKDIKVLSLADFKEFCEKCSRDEDPRSERDSLAPLARSDRGGQLSHQGAKVA